MHGLTHPKLELSQDGRYRLQQGTSQTQNQSLATSVNSATINNRVYNFGTLGYTIMYRELKNKITVDVGNSIVSVVSRQKNFFPQSVAILTLIDAGRSSLPVRVRPATRY